MIERISRKNRVADFPESAPAANPVFFRTYSRRTESGLRESYDQVCDRTIKGLVELGKLTEEEAYLLDKMQRQLKALPSGRWLWVGGTEWVTKPKNFPGGYNCTSTNLKDWEAFGLMMDLTMMGSGSGAILEPKYIDKLPIICNKIKVTIEGEIGSTEKEKREEFTTVIINDNVATIKVGDSREGWVKSYQSILELSSNEQFNGNVQIVVNVSDIRSSGERLKGFGGIANPGKLLGLYNRMEAILNRAVGRQLTSVECCLLIDEAAIAIVAGNVRRSAGMRQFISDDELGSKAKDNLWQQDEQGNWSIDPERDALRMANHTRVFHKKPTLNECIESVQKQYYSGEGAIQWAGEAVARANVDLLTTKELKTSFLKAYQNGKGKEWVQENHPGMREDELEHRLSRYGLNPCVTSETWIHTEYGARQVKDLVGKQLGVYVNGELFSTTPDGFFFTGVKPVVKIQTEEGYELRLTENHQVLRITIQTQNRQYSKWCETKDLKPGDKILVHNHRKINPWDGLGSYEEGQAIGNLLNDNFSRKHQAALQCWDKAKTKVREYLKNVYDKATEYFHLTSLTVIKDKNKKITPEIEQGSYSFYCGFLGSLFDINGKVDDQKISLIQDNLEDLKAVQRMLLRLGIVSKISVDNQQELTINKDNILIFKEVIGFHNTKKSELLNSLISEYKGNSCRERFDVKIKSITDDGIESVYDCTVPGVSRFDANGIIAHNCGEIVGTDFFCNLSEVHLNQLNPDNYKEQEEAFTAGAMSAAILLNHEFVVPRYRYSRELDPIVGVSFTGLFDFFVNAFGVNWLRWWEQGRPETSEGLSFKRAESEYLNWWKGIVHKAVWSYCDNHGLKRPNRCTTVQPSGTKALLTGASPGWHPPKAQRFIRRVTFRKEDPVALACLDYGYNVIPSQSDRDENGNLLNDPFDYRCTEWLVEIPVAVPWADLPGADDIDVSKFSVLAQLDFVMQVQKYYTAHNTSATLELRSDEIEPLGTRIYESIKNDEGYISAALLARFDDIQTFPRLPFEPIDAETYKLLSKQVKERRKSDDFCEILRKYDLGELVEAGPSGCDSDKCMLPETKPV